MLVHQRVYIIYIYSNILTSLCPLCQAHHWWCLRCRPMRNVPCAGPQPPLGPCSWLAWQQLGDETDIFNPNFLGYLIWGYFIYIYMYMYVVYIYIYLNIDYIHIYIYVVSIDTQYVLIHHIMLILEYRTFIILYLIFWILYIYLLYYMF